MKATYIILLCLPVVAGGSVLKFKPQQILDTIDQLTGKLASQDNEKWPPAFCNKLDCPKYTVLKSEKGYELREYVVTQWVSTNIAGVDYREASSEDFKRLFNYISGSNEKKEKIDMTAPVLIQIIPGQGPACESNFTMSFFLASKILDPPKPTNSKVFIRREEKVKVYVRSFSGYVMYDIKKWQEEAAELAKDINNPDLYRQDYFYTAGYDSPFQFFNRHNEIWFISN